MPGPVPKRSDQRRRMNKPEIDIEQMPAGVEIEWPEPDEKWHPIARRWYESLQVSGQSVFYEQSDVMTAFYVTEKMHTSLTTSMTNGQMFASVMSAMSSLLVTEGDRRRLRIELQRTPAGPSDADIAATADLANYRKRLA